MKFLLVDLYTDEPDCLGVPPFVAPQIRYTLALLEYFEDEVEYILIDDFRKIYKKNLDYLKQFNVICFHGGVVVPGKYLNANPASAKELVKILSFLKNKLTNTDIVISGPVLAGLQTSGGSKYLNINWQDFTDWIVEDNNLVCFLWKELIGEEIDLFELLDKIFSEITEINSLKTHKYYPHLIAEIQTMTYCDKKVKCSYCYEVFNKYKNTRTIESIEKELKVLKNTGIKAIRFGNQPNILAWMGEDVGSKIFKPNYKALEELYSLANEYFDVVTTDNLNAMAFIYFEEEAVKAVESIKKYNSKYDTLSFGIEDVANKVIKINNLKVEKDQALHVIKLLNEIDNGENKVLPGINFLLGLPGSDKETLKENYKFLEQILENNLLLRRINIRKVSLIKGTLMEKLLKKYKPKLKDNDYFKFREFVRKHIDLQLIKKVFPIGTKFKIVVEEVHKNYAYGRFLGSYPPICYVNGKFRLFQEIEVEVINYGSRSLEVKPV